MTTFIANHRGGIGPLLAIASAATWAIGRAATYLALIPVFGVFGSAVVLDEQVTWIDASGGLLVVGCLLVDATAHARAVRAKADLIEVSDR